ncbi:MAG: hypothetical protein K2W92_02780 [Alphaproteobacteria bacterium]|nr:hypothetical protein [Alphaproteobacteria bacterium]
MFNLYIFVVVVSVIILISFKIKSFFSSFGKERIKLEFIPATQYFLNVRAAVEVPQWEAIAKTHYREAKGHCEICSKKARMECHELWNFDTNTFTQKLVGMVALCHECHGGIHYGHTIHSKDRADAARITKHLLKVNHWSVDTLQNKMTSAQEEAARLTRLARNGGSGYKLDLTYLNQKKYRLAELRKMTNDERSRCIKKESY